MYITHSTSVPIKFSDEFIQEILNNHNKIVSESKNLKRENTKDASWSITQPSICPPWC